MLYYFSQTFAFVALVSVFISFQCKKKSALLVWTAVVNGCLAISYVFLADWVGTTLLIVATIRCMCFFFIRTKQARLSISLPCLLLFLIIHCIATALTWTYWFDFVLLGGIILLTLGLWTKGNNFVRIATIVYASLMIVHNTSVKNWVALVVDIVTITAIAVYYLRRILAVRRAKKNVN